MSNFSSISFIRVAPGFSVLMAVSAFLIQGCSDSKTVDPSAIELAITDAEIAPNPFKAGEEVVITFTVTAPEQITAILGSNLSDGTKPYYDFKPEGNQTVILKPGTHQYRVTADVPDHTPEGNYVLRAAIWRDDHPNSRIDSDFHSPNHDTLLWGPKVVRGGCKCQVTPNE